jgi:hypothetical protein
VPTSGTCPWCEQPIPPRARRDSKFCSKRCRQASHRFGSACVSRARAATSLRFAYADPPYPGLAARYYRDHPDFAGEVDHRALLSRLQAYDGWGLSTSSDALPYVLGLCNELRLDVRVAAWVRGSRAGLSAWPKSAWEAVVYAGGRRVVSRDVGDDALVLPSRPRTTDPRRVVGAKPSRFAYWLFDLLGARPGDELDDLFPGSRGIGRAWDLYASRGSGRDASLVDVVDASAAE